jgi:hypothetical protein
MVTFTVPVASTQKAIIAIVEKCLAMPPPLLLDRKGVAAEPDGKLLRSHHQLRMARLIGEGFDPASSEWLLRG